jgi:hypothetical protein
VSQTVAAIAADLGPAHTGKSIGYRVLNLDRTTYSAFGYDWRERNSIAGMGYYVKSGGRLAGRGRLYVWGTSGTDYHRG